MTGIQEKEWLVVRKRETDPWEVYCFTEYSEAVQFFDRAQAQWSDTFLCSIIHGPGRPLRNISISETVVLREVLKDAKSWIRKRVGVEHWDNVARNMPTSLFGRIDTALSE